MKRVQVFCEEEPERPKTANLARPSVLDPALVDKLDMSLLSKELLCDSMTRFHQLGTNGKPVSGSTTSSSSSSSLSLLLPSPPSTIRRRQSAAVNIATTTTTWSSHDIPVRRKRRSFEQNYELRVTTGQMEIDGSDSLAGSQKATSPAAVATQEYGSTKRSSDVRRLDDNNNKLVIITSQMINLIF